MIKKLAIFIILGGLGVCFAYSVNGKKTALTPQDIDALGATNAASAICGDPVTPTAEGRTLTRKSIIQAETDPSIHSAISESSKRYRMGFCGDILRRYRHLIEVTSYD